MDYFYKYKGQDIKVSIGKRLSFIDLNQGAWTKYVNNKQQIKAVLIKMKELIDNVSKNNMIKLIVVGLLSLCLLQCSSMNNIKCQYNCVRTLNGNTQPPSWGETCYPVNCEAKDHE